MNDDELRTVGFGSLAREKSLEAERDALAARVAELEAALQARQRAVDSVIVKSMEIHSNEEALEAVCAALGWDAGEDVCISAMLAAVDAAKRIETLAAALRDLLDELTIEVDHPAWRRYTLGVKLPRQDDPVGAARRALEGAGDAREG